MKTGNKIMIGCGIFFVLGILIVVILGGSVWSQHGELTASKNKIDAKYKANQSDYDKMWKTFTETAQVTELQAEQFKSTYSDIITGRYKNDVNVAMKMITEDNPKMDSTLYKELVHQLEANRSTFSNNQTALLDIINQYNTLVEHDDIIAAYIFRFDKMDTSKYIVTSDRTDKAFDSGKDDAIDIMGSNKKDESADKSSK